MTIQKIRGDFITCNLQTFEYRGPHTPIYVLEYVYQGSDLTAFKYMQVLSHDAGPCSTWHLYNWNWHNQLHPTGQPINLGYANAALIIATDPDWVNQLVLKVWPNEVYFYA